MTAGVTRQLSDKTDVAVAANEKQMVAQGIEDTQTKEAVSENTTEDKMCIRDRRLRRQRILK